MVNSLKCLESQIEQSQDGVVARHIGILEDHAGSGTLLWRELFTSFLQQTISFYVIEITKADFGALLQAFLYQACADAIGTAFGERQYFGRSGKANAGVRPQARRILAYQ